MRKRRLAIALAGLAVATLLPAAPALAAAKPSAPASPSPSATKLPPGINFDPGKAKCTTAKTASGTTEHCQQAAHLPLKDLTAAQWAQRKQMMTKLAAQGKQAPAAASATTPAGSAAAAAGGPPAACDFVDITFPPTYTAHPSRFLSCEDGLWTVFDYEVVNGAFSLVGDFSFEDQAWINYSATKLSWVHDMETLAYGGDGTLEAGLTGYVASNCYIVPTACTATNSVGPDPQAVYLAPGGTYDYEWTEQDAGPVGTTSGAVDTLDANLGVAWDLNDGSQPWDTQETGGLSGRCDSLATSKSKGCVDEAFIPSMYPSYAVDGASADMIDYAEWNLAPYYGNQYSSDPTPLHRLTDPILIGTPNSEGNNREVICDGSFTPDSAITAALAPYSTPKRQETDSCDEYPFNATYESGAMADGADGNPKPYVTTGANCAQVKANHTNTYGDDEATDWNSVSLTSNTNASAPCIRGHIPSLLNSHVGSEYSALITTDRLIDKDPFWVEVTP